MSATAVIRPDAPVHGELDGAHHPWSVADTLDSCTPYLAAPLVTGMALARLQTTARRLPAALTRHAYLECRLHPCAGRVDLILGVAADARPVLAGAAPWGAWWNGSGPSELLWERVRALSAEWSSERSAVAAGLGRLWLEFDHRAQRSDWPAAPGVFVELKRSAVDGGAARWLTAVAAALRPVLGSDITHSVRRRLLACATALPNATAIPYVGVFPSRSSVDLRVCAAGMSAADIPRYLGAVGWSGDPVSARRICALARPGAPVIVNLDVGATVGPQLGIEIMVPRRDQHRGILNAQALLAIAVDNGWADAAKIAALHEFPGNSVSRFGHELWPSRIERRVNHLKFVMRADGVIGAKVYLSVRHEPSAV